MRLELACETCCVTRRRTDPGWWPFAASLFVAMLASRAASGVRGPDEAPAGVEWIVATLLIATVTWILMLVPTVMARAWVDAVSSAEVGRRARVLWARREAGGVASGAVWFAISAVVVIGSPRVTTFWWPLGAVGLIVLWVTRSAVLPFEPSVRIGHHPAPADIDAAVRSLADEARVTVRNVWVAENTTGLQRSVASAGGFGRSGTIRLSSRLAASDPVLVRGVSAHELGHLASPVWRRAIVPAALQSVIVVGAWAAVASTSGVTFAGSAYSVPWFALVTTFVMTLFGPLFARLQRSEELRADAYAGRLLADPTLYAQVLTVIDAESDDAGIYGQVSFGASHPPTQERIAALGVRADLIDSD